MFQDFKNRAIDKLKSLAPPDELDKAIASIVESGTAETLPGPDWGKNMELVDFINKNPEVLGPKLLRVLTRTMTKPVVRTQVLTLTMLDTCIRNCHPILHVQLAQSVLWADLLKLVQDTSVHRIDLEVRDKILAMVEDYGRYLKNPPSYAETYENLVDQGLDFPVRSSDEIVAIEVMDIPLPQSQPTHEPPAAAAAGGTGGSGSLFANLLSNFSGAVGGGAAAAPGHGAAATGTPLATGAVGDAAPGVQPRRRGVDPAVLEGLSEEDRAAVQMAMDEMAFEMESAQEAAAIAASLGAQPAAGVPALPISTHNSTNLSPVTPYAPVSPTQRPAPPPPAAPVLPETNEDALQVITNSVGVFSDMVGGVSDEDPSGVRDPLIRDLADQCSQYRSRLAQMALEVTDETLLIAALNQNDVLGAAMARYDALLAQAMSQGPMTATSPASDTATRAAAAASAISLGNQANNAGPNFTLLDDDEEEGEALATGRNQGPAVPGLPSPGAASPGPTQPPAEPAAQAPLLDLLGDDPLPPPAAPPAGAAVPAVPPLPVTTPVSKDEPLI